MVDELALSRWSILLVMERRKARRRLLVEGGLLAACAAALSWLAWRLYPAWDDGWLWLQMGATGADLHSSMADRPLVGGIWSLLVRTNAFVALSTVAHGVAWWSLGLLTRSLWAWLFPQRRGFGLVAALLAMSTVVLDVQHVLIIPVWCGVVGSAMVYLALLLVLRQREPGGRPGVRWRAVAAVALVAAAVLLSEYGLVATFAAAALLAVAARPLPAAARRGRLRIAALLVAVAVATYVVFVLTADVAARPDTSPGRLLDLPLRRLAATPFILLTRVWHATAGHLLARAGEVTADSWEGLLACLVAAAAAAVVVLLLRRGGDDAAAEAARAGSAWALWALVAAVALGLGVMVAVGRVPWSGPTTRFYLPVAPPAACLGLWLVLWPLRAALQRKAAAAIAFAAVFATLEDAGARLTEARAAARLASAVAPSLDRELFTLVLVVDPERRLGREAVGYELTARVAHALGLGTGDGFWVVRYADRKDEGVSGVDRIGEASGRPELRLGVRGLAGRYPVDRVVWVELSGDEVRVRPERAVR